MLESLRNASKSWIVRILFALLVLSFISWGGMGDMFTPGRKPAIEIGETGISASQVEAEFRREVERLQPLFGGKLTVEDARKLGMLERTVDTLVTRTLVDEAGRELGLATSDEAVLRAIAANPQLHNEQGQFDRELLRRLISGARMTEAEFFRAERDNLVRSQMAEALSGGLAAPAALVRPLVRHRNERRVAEFVEIRDESVPLPAAPGDAELEAHYKENAARFMAPERRNLSLLLLRPADVGQSIQVTDAQVAEAYQQRLDEFTTPERRELSQIVLADEIQAGRAGEMLRQGKSLAAIASALSVDVVDLGEVERADLPDELADPVFALSSGETAQPVRTGLGWHVVKVGKVSPGKVRSLAEVQGELRDDIRREQSLDVMADLANKIEDTLGGGATLEEAAKGHGLDLMRVVAVDSKGRGPDGKRAAGLPASETVLDVAFRVESGQESSLTDLEGGGYFLLRVDSVTPPAPRPLAEIRSEVQYSWQAAKRREAASARAAQLAERAKLGGGLDEAARAMGLKAATTKPFARDGADAGALPPALVADLFRAQMGAVAVGEGKGATVVARLAKVVPFEGDGAQALAEESRRISTAIGGDLVDQYLGALRADLGVKVDRAQLAREE